MQDLKIGQPVLVTVVSDVDYVEFPNRGMDGAKRGIIDIMCEPMTAFIVGQIVKQLGTYRAASGYDEDYQPPYLEQYGNVTLWQVRTGMRNKPLLVRDENIVLLQGDFKIPSIASRPRFILGQAA